MPNTFPPTDPTIVSAPGVPFDSHRSISVGAESRYAIPPWKPTMLNVETDAGLSPVSETVPAAVPSDLYTSVRPNTVPLKYSVPFTSVSRVGADAPEASKTEKVPATVPSVRNSFGYPPDLVAP